MFVPHGFLKRYVVFPLAEVRVQFKRTTPFPIVEATDARGAMTYASWEEAELSYTEEIVQSSNKATPPLDSIQMKSTSPSTWHL